MVDIIKIGDVMVSIPINIIYCMLGFICLNLFILLLFKFCLYKKMFKNN